MEPDPSPKSQDHSTSAPGVVTAWAVNDIASLAQASNGVAVKLTSAGVPVLTPSGIVIVFVQPLTVVIVSEIV